MSESKALAIVAEGALPVRNPEKEIAAIVERTAQAHAQTLEDAATLWYLDEAVLATLKPRQRAIAEAAKMPKSEAPYGLIMAHEFALAREKREAMKSAQDRSVNITIDQRQQGVIIPAMAPRAAAQDVVMVDADSLKAKDDE